MTCKETERLIIPYLRGDLNEKATKHFLDHMKTCDSCYEEMEIHYMATTGLERLESGSSIDIESEMRKILSQSERKIKQRTRIKLASTIIDTIAIIAVIFTLIVQVNIWVSGEYAEINVFGVEIGREK